MTARLGLVILLAACASSEPTLTKPSLCEARPDACRNAVTHLQRAPELSCVALEDVDGAQVWTPRVDVAVDGWTGGGSVVHLWGPDPETGEPIHERHPLCTTSFGFKDDETWVEELVAAPSPAAPDTPPTCGEVAADEPPACSDGPFRTAFPCDGDTDELEEWIRIAVVVTESNGDLGRGGDCVSSRVDASEAAAFLASDAIECEYEDCARWREL